MRLLSTEEWDLVEKCFMRELTRRRGPTYDVALATNAKIDADNAVRSSMVRHALSVDKCMTVVLGSYAQPGQDLDWLYVACLAARFAALTYQDQALIVSTLEQGQCIDWTHQRWAYAIQTPCPNGTAIDDSYKSIANLRKASWDPYNVNAGPKYVGAGGITPPKTPSWKEWCLGLPSWQRNAIPRCVEELAGGTGTTPVGPAGFDWASYCAGLPEWARAGVPVCATAGVPVTPGGGAPGPVGATDWKAYCATLPPELAKMVPQCGQATAGGPGATATPVPGLPTGTDLAAYCASLPANIAASIPGCAGLTKTGGSAPATTSDAAFKEWHDPGPNCRWHCRMTATGNKDTDAASTAQYIDCLKRNDPNGPRDYLAIATWYTQAQPGWFLEEGGPEACPSTGTTTPGGAGAPGTTTTTAPPAAEQKPWYKQPVTYVVGGLGAIIGLGAVVASLRKP